MTGSPQLAPIHALAASARVHIAPHMLHHQGVNKQIRIRRLGPLLAMRRIRFRAASPGARELVNQLRDFPIGDHDDGPDSLEMAFRLAGVIRGDEPADRAPNRLPLESL